MTHEELKQIRPVNQERVEKYKAQMMAYIASFQLKELREKKAITQKELAKKANVSQNAISKLENRKIEDVKIGTALKYAKTLGQPFSIKIGKQEFVF